MADVTITRSWTFEAASRELGRMKLATNLKNSEGESFNSIAIEAPSVDELTGEETTKVTFCHFGASMPVEKQNAAYIKSHKDTIKIGLNSNGKYTCFEQNGGWEEL